MKRQQQGFAHLVLVIVPVVLLLLIGAGYHVRAKKHAKKDDARMAMSECPKANAGLFTSDVTELANINLIQTPIRLIGGKNIKTHSYIGVTKRSAVYAPMDAQLNGGANYYEIMGPQPVTKVQYILSFNQGCDVSFWLDHIVDVPDKIKAAFPAEPRNDTHGVTVKTLSIKAGELIGYTNQTGSARFDFGALNLKGPATSLTTNPRFKDDPIVQTSDKYRYATCPYNLYDTQKQKVYQALYDPRPDGDQEIIDDICR